MTLDEDVYKRIDRLYPRYKKLCENTISSARHHEFQAALVIANLLTKNFRNPYQQELFDQFKFLYKLNVPTLLSDLKSFIPACREEHLHKRDKYQNTEKRQTKISFDKTRKGIFRFLPTVKLISQNENPYVLNNDFFELDSEQIITYLIHQLVYEKVYDHFIAEYPKLEDPAYVEKVVSELEPREEPIKLELPDISFNISKTATADIIYQLIHEKVLTEEGEVPVLSYTSEKELYKLLRIIDPRFRDTKDSTLKGYFSDEKRNVPKNNRVEIKIIR